MHEQLGKFVVAREHSPIWLPACPTWMVTTSRGIANARCVLAAVLVVRALCLCRRGGGALPPDGTSLSVT